MTRRNSGLIRLLLSTLWILLGVVAFLSLARVFIWGLSWYFIRTALAIGLAYYVMDRVRRLRQVQRLRVLTFRAWLEED
ncbi:hypothetical protein MY494_04535 [Synechococcus sp. A10-1-5-1]|jgi:hypothetical protein|uniref:hypothetical protein n=1 Tax=Synechococcus sp. A10-1-5-1 TaxID=2936507 RepID=UPI002001A98B|nr:hypothetical protein [Synechococcus sp. A10-1-5-1]UPM51046.1 hypothetical protein MY494_04535 [Synechococcus sp. A10-1-5-1]